MSSPSMGGTRRHDKWSRRSLYPTPHRPAARHARRGGRVIERTEDIAFADGGAIRSPEWTMRPTVRMIARPRRLISRTNRSPRRPFDMQSGRNATSSQSEVTSHEQGGELGSSASTSRPSSVESRSPNGYSVQRKRATVRRFSRCAHRVATSGLLFVRTQVRSSAPTEHRPLPLVHRQRAVVRTSHRDTRRTSSGAGGTIRAPGRSE
jgi:hypothetical protein